MALKKYTSERRLWLWGNNTQGQLGDDTIAAKSSPVQTVTGGSNWKMVWQGADFTAGIKTDGTLWSWGNNANGELGDGTSGVAAYKSSPVQTIAAGNDWKQVSSTTGRVSGQHFTAAIKTDGTLWTWGFNTQGQLGDNLIAHKSSPVQTVAGGTDWSFVESGGRHAVAIKTDGTLWLWGYGLNGQLGDDTSANKSSPVQTVAGGTDWKQVSANTAHTAGIKTDGTLWNWGQNSEGQLGINASGATHKSSPVQTVAGGTDWAQVSCGAKHTGAIKTDGSLWMWGENYQGRLGDDTVAPRSSPVQTLTGGTGWTQVACGYKQTAAIKTGGGLWIWGADVYGQLGVNSTVHKSSPVQTVAGGSNWKQVACGYKNTAAIQETNVQKTEKGLYLTKSEMLDQYPDLVPQAKKPALWMWGRNDVYGQLGDDTVLHKSSPVQTIAGGFNWKAMSGGNAFSAGIKTDGTLWLWGSGTGGELGDGTAVSKSSPVQTIAGGNDWKSIACGRNAIASIKTDGTLWTWGNNANGELGDDSVVPKSSPVQTVIGGNDWKSIGCGQYIAGAIKTDGTLWTWGSNTHGDLGDNSIIKRSSPVQTVTAGTNWATVAMGRRYAGAIKTDGTLWMWGWDAYGQLGDNATASKSSPVQTISGGTDWSDLACGYRGLTGAIKTDGTLWTWGFGTHGGLGDGTAASRSSPVQTIAGGNDWKKIQCGYSHILSLKTDGTIWGWGLNANYGILGDDTTVNRSSPVQTVMGGANWKNIGVGWRAGMAISEGDDW